MNLLAHEPLLRAAAALAMLGIMVVAEALAPQRKLLVGRGWRWASNLGLVLLNTALVRLLLPTASVGIAVLAAERGLGLLNVWVVPEVPGVLISVVVLDLAIYLQHRVFHAVPLLWRLHRVHHADLDFDVTTGLRFHPGEILLSQAIKSLAIVALGPPAMAVLVFELVLNGMALFNHANVRLPRMLDRWLRLALVTPDMHRVHHSVVVAETNSNFGFNLALWDRVLGSYRAQPTGGQQGLVIGLPDCRDPLAADRLPAMLAMPFRA